MHAWDYAAPSIIVEEAGGYCCDTTGAPVDLMARKVCHWAQPNRLSTRAASMRLGSWGKMMADFVQLTQR